MMRTAPRTMLAMAAAIGALALFAPAAGAQGPAGHMTLIIERAHPVGASLAAPRGQFLRVRGIVTPYVPGQEVAIRAVTGGRTVAFGHRSIVPVGTHGEFAMDFHTSRIGALRVRVGHAETPELGRIDAISRPVYTFAAAAGEGARGLRVRYLQSRLYAMGYSVSRGGYYDFATAQAVLAFRKVNRLGRFYFASPTVYGRLAANIGGFIPHYPRLGGHVEADLTHQVLALISPGGRVFRVLTLSSGKPSTPTVLGIFHVYSKTPGTNSHGMLNSNYFIGGYAIHGYPDVPTYPASHGCLRIPNRLAGFVFGWVKYGTPVAVYYRSRAYAPTRRIINRHPGP